MSPAPTPGAEAPLSPELDRHLSDPGQKTEEVSGEQDRAKAAESPTEPDAGTEGQPT